MNDTDLINAFISLVAGERQRVQQMAQKHTPRQLEQEIYGTRHLFQLVHPQAYRVIDRWIKEAKDG